MSVILERYADEIANLTKYCGMGLDTIGQETVRNLIAKEKESEKKGVVVPIKIATGYDTRPGEFLYHGFDNKTDKVVRFKYVLTPEERRRLGWIYKSEKEDVPSPQEARMWCQLREDVQGGSDFSSFGMGD